MTITQNAPGLVLGVGIGLIVLGAFAAWVSSQKGRGQ